MVRIAPSITAADFARLGDALAVIKEAGAQRLHIDVMDGHFAPDITVGQPVIESLRRRTDLEMEVHLLIERPERFIEAFADAGADRIAIHAEATTDVHRAIERVHGLGRKAGLALNPATPLEAASEILPRLDFLLILTADPALEEGPYVEGMTDKIARAAALRRERGLEFEIEAEGGIRLENDSKVISAGADILVAGSAIFGTGDPKANLQRMMCAGTQAEPVSNSSPGAPTQRA